jgi:hypothetical protein
MSLHSYYKHFAVSSKTTAFSFVIQVVQQIPFSLLQLQYLNRYYVDFYNETTQGTQTYSNSLLRRVQEAKRVNCKKISQRKWHYLYEVLYTQPGSGFMKNCGNKVGKMGDGCELQGLQHSQDYVYPDPPDHFTLPS